MPSLTEWKVPLASQPRAGDYSFDLDRVLASVIGLHSIIPGDAFSADILGTERAGNGVLIDDGLVLTIGYLITEAASVSIRCRSVVRLMPRSATAWWWAAQADARAPSPAISLPSRSSPVTGSICWTRRSSPIPRIPIGAVPG